MFVDAGVIVSIFAGEDSAAAYEQALMTAEMPFTSPLAAWEAIIVLSRPDQLNCSYAASHAIVTKWLELRSIALRESGAPAAILRHAVKVAQDHGIGRRALSNFDCFHYAYAKAMNEALLTSDAHLRQTDVETRPALAISS